MREMLKIGNTAAAGGGAEPPTSLNERESEIIRMIFSNLTSPEKFPQEFG